MQVLYLEIYLHLYLNLKRIWKRILPERKIYPLEEKNYPVFSLC